MSMPWFVSMLSRTSSFRSVFSRCSVLASCDAKQSTEIRLRFPPLGDTMIAINTKKNHDESFGPVSCLK